MGRLVFICALCAGICGSAFAGPMDNAQQFQKKAVSQTMKKQYEKQYTTSTQRAVVVSPSSKSVVSMPAETKATAAVTASSQEATASSASQTEKK